MCVQMCVPVGVSMCLDRRWEMSRWSYDGLKTFALQVKPNLSPYLDCKMHKPMAELRLQSPHTASKLETDRETQTECNFHFSNVTLMFSNM